MAAQAAKTVANKSAGKAVEPFEQDAGEVVQRANGEIVAAEDLPVEFVDLVAWYHRHFGVDVTPELQVQANIASRIMAADSVDDVLGQAESLPSAGEFVWQPLELLAVDSMGPGVGPLGIVVRISAVIVETGEAILFNAGSPGILSQLRRLIELDSLPMQCMVAPVSGSRSDPGRNPPLYLRPLGWKAAQKSARS